MTRKLTFRHALVVLAVALCFASAPAATAEPVASKGGAGSLAAGPFWWASGNSLVNERMVLDVRGPSTADFAWIHLWEYHGGSSQYWYMDQAGTSGGHTVWYMRNQYSGKCMDLQGTGTGDGTRVVQARCDGSSGQQWRQEFQFRGENRTYYRFRNIMTGRCLDNYNGNADLGNKIQIWTCSAGVNYNQLWW